MRRRRSRLNSSPVIQSCRCSMLMNDAPLHSYFGWVAGERRFGGASIRESAPPVRTMIAAACPDFNLAATAGTVSSSLEKMIRALFNRRKVETAAEARWGVWDSVAAVL